MGYKLNISIAYLFDDADFSRYIEDKILGKGYDNEGQEIEMDADGNEIVQESSNVNQERDIMEVFWAMSNGKIEQILTGDQMLGNLNESQQKECNDLIMND